jgi:hypothetical protein
MATAARLSSLLEAYINRVRPRGSGFSCQCGIAHQLYLYVRRLMYPRAGLRIGIPASDRARFCTYMHNLLSCSPIMAPRQLGNIDGLPDPPD